MREGYSVVSSFLRQVTKEEDHHSLSIPDALFGGDSTTLHSFCFESMLKPEKNKDK